MATLLPFTLLPFVDRGIRGGDVDGRPYYRKMDLFSMDSNP